MLIDIGSIIHQLAGDNLGYRILFLEKTKGPMQLGSTNDLAAKPEVNATLEKNRLALQVLHKLDVIPEHIESRTLYNDDCPGIPQVP